MSGMDGARREIRKLRLKLAERDFRAGAPPLDEDDLPMWGGEEPLTTEGYAKALDQGVPAEDLTPQELETRHRLAPYASVFSRLEEEGEDV